jgi:hypothetical protein
LWGRGSRCIAAFIFNFGTRWRDEKNIRGTVMSCFKILLYPVLGRTEENYENMSQVDGLVVISLKYDSDHLSLFARALP